MPRRRRRTVSLHEGRTAHRYGKGFTGYGRKPTIAPIKAAKKSVTKEKKAIAKAPASAAKTTAVRKVKKAATAVKSAEHAVARVRAQAQTRPLAPRKKSRYGARRRGAAYGSPISAILASYPAYSRRGSRRAARRRRAG